MANKKANVKDLKNISSFGRKQLALWGIIGAVILFAYSLVALLLIHIVHLYAFDLVLEIVGLGLGVLYMILGIFALVNVSKDQKEDMWWLILLGGIFAVLAPLAWYSGAGIALSILAGISFTVYYLIKK